VHLGNGQFYRHGNVLLGDFGGRARASKSPIEVNDVGSSIVRSNSDHVHIMGCADLDGHQRRGIDCLNPIQMFHVIFNRIGRVEGEGTEQTDKRHASAHLGHLFASLCR
jgi:hypothetical protein